MSQIDIISMLKLDSKNHIMEQFRLVSELDTPARALSCLYEKYADQELRDDLLRYLQQLEYTGLGQIQNTITSAIGLFLVVNPNEEEFYEKIWTFITSASVYTDDGTRAMAMALSLIDPRLPYHHHEILSMSNDEYGMAIGGLEDKIQEIRRIAQRDFPQKTQEASVILEVLESEEDRNKRVVLLSDLLAYMRSFGSASVQ